MRSMRAFAVTAAALFAAGIVWAAPESVDTLAQDLRSGDMAVRVRAIQLLPHHNLAGVVAAAPLVADPDRAVADAAFKAVWSAVNQLARPGMEAQREPASCALLPLLTPDRPREVRERGLRLWAVVVPEGFDAAPVAALLKDAELGEPARQALERAGTSEARAALREALAGADAVQARALADSLGSLQDIDSVPALTELAEHEDPQVRAAAARALAWTGDPAVAETVRRVRSRADADTALAAADAQLRLADAMAARGGNWDRAMALYGEALETAPNRSVKAAAIVGMARYGDDTVVEPIVAAARAEGGEFERILATAFGYLPGAAASQRIAEAVPGLSHETRLAVVSVLGRRADAHVVAPLAEAARSEDAGLRLAALAALGDTRQPAAMDILAEAAQAGSDDEKAVVEDAARRLAEGLLERGLAQDAGRSFAQLLGMARDDTLRRAALGGIARSPVAEVDTAILDAVRKSPALGAEAAPALAAVAELYARNNDNARALATYEALYNEVSPSPETLFAVADRVRQLGKDLGNLLEVLGVVTSWHVAGPFPSSEQDYETPYVGEPRVSMGDTYPAGDGRVGWKPVTADTAGRVDLLAALGNLEKQFGYAYAEVVVDRDTEARAMLGTDDGFRLWVNGELVKEVRGNRGLVVDSDRVDIRLRQGRNAILLKIYQNVMGWEYCVRLTDRQGKGLRFDP